MKIGARVTDETDCPRGSRPRRRHRTEPPGTDRRHPSPRGRPHRGARGVRVDL